MTEYTVTETPFADVAAKYVADVDANGVGWDQFVADAKSDPGEVAWEWVETAGDLGYDLEEPGVLDAVFSAAQEWVASLHTAGITDLWLLVHDRHPDATFEYPGLVVLEARDGTTFVIDQDGDLFRLGLYASDAWREGDTPFDWFEAPNVAEVSECLEDYLEARSHIADLDDEVEHTFTVVITVNDKSRDRAQVRDALTRQLHALPFVDVTRLDIHDDDLLSEGTTR